MTFKEWLLKFTSVDLPIGDLASDVARDPYFPEKNDYETISNYLISKNVDSAVIETFNSVWKFYQDSK